MEEVVVAELRKTSRYVACSKDRVKGLSHLVAEETARDVDLLASHDDNLLAGEDLLRDDRGQSTKEMTLAIDDDGCRGEGGHGKVYVGVVNGSKCTRLLG